MDRLNQIQELISKVQCAMMVCLLIRTSVSVKMNKLSTISEQLSYAGEHATVRKEDVWDRQALVGKPISQVYLPYQGFPIKHYTMWQQGKNHKVSL